MKLLYDNINNYTNKNYKSFLPILSKQDKTKLNKILKINDQKLFILSRFLLNKLLKETYNIKYNNITIFYNQFNKPLTNNFYFNISHKEEYCIVVTSTKKIGVDIEKIKQVDIKIINYFCTKYEKEYILNSTNKYKSLFEIYCLKEAYIKMLGTNLSNIKNIEFKLNNNKFICSNNNNIQINLIDNIDNYIVAIIEEN